MAQIEFKLLVSRQIERFLKTDVCPQIWANLNGEIFITVKIFNIVARYRALKFMKNKIVSWVDWTWSHTKITSEFFQF